MRRVYIETYGCQMNVADSELMAGVLKTHGFAAASSAEEADVVLLNTCAIREKAEDRIYGRLGWLKSLKAQRPGMLLGITGCMAEHVRDSLLQRAPYVDIVAGPDVYRRLPELIEQATGEERDPMIDVRLDRRELYEGIEPSRAAGVSGWLTIMRGCDKFCTFCIVPFVRGRERSLPPDEIVSQVHAMVRQGFKEVTLLGQTVSSYSVENCNFAQLLTRIHDETEIQRVRFTSPYPTDFDDDLIETIARLPRIAKHLHLPLQSGSTRILNDMQRRYSAEEYLALVEKIRGVIPDVALTTDVIVGYPDESDADFEATLALCDTVTFDSAFMFMYSERPGTLAAKQRPDSIPESVKSERLQRLIKLQERSSQKRSAAMVGKEVEVLVDGCNPREPEKQIGRSSCFKMTVLDKGNYAFGDMVRARVGGATTHTLFATPC